MVELRELKIWQIWCTVAFLFTAGVLLAYWFRTETWDSPAFGIFQQKYRWGFAYEQLVDTNRDGSPDARALFDGTSRSFGAHEQPIEYWEDRDNNGVFEIHAVYDGDVIVWVELDHDQDERYDQVLTGTEAAHFFESFLPKSESADG